MVLRKASVVPKYLQNHLDGCTLRFNRRKLKNMGKKLLYIAQQAVKFSEITKFWNKITFDMAPVSEYFMHT